MFRKKSQGLGFRGLGFRGLVFRKKSQGLGFRGLGFRGLGFRKKSPTSALDELSMPDCLTADAKALSPP